jgi:hypothetical protein
MEFGAFANTLIRGSRQCAARGQHVAIARRAVTLAAGTLDPVMKACHCMSALKLKRRHRNG